MWLLKSLSGGVVEGIFKSEAALAKRLGVSQQYVNRQLRKNDRVFHLDGKKVIAKREKAFAAGNLTFYTKSDLASHFEVSEEDIARVFRKKSSGFLKTPTGGKIKITKLKPGEIRAPQLETHPIVCLRNEENEKQEFSSFAAAAKAMKIDSKTIPHALKAGRNSFTRKSDKRKFTIEIIQPTMPKTVKPLVKEKAPPAVEKAPPAVEKEEKATPAAEVAAPEEVVFEVAAPEEIVFEVAELEEVAPEEVAPQEVVFEVAAPEEIVFEVAELEEVAPEEVVFEVAAPEEIVFEVAELEEVAPEEVAPEEVAPEEVAPEEVAPEEQKKEQKKELVAEVKTPEAEGCFYLGDVGTTSSTENSVYLGDGWWQKKPELEFDEDDPFYDWVYKDHCPRLLNNFDDLWAASKQKLLQPGEKVKRCYDPGEPRRVLLVNSTFDTILDKYETHEDFVDQFYETFWVQGADENYLKENDDVGMLPFPDPDSKGYLWIVQITPAETPQSQP